jgi:hypothetical protein
MYAGPGKKPQALAEGGRAGLNEETCRQGLATPAQPEQDKALEETRAWQATAVVAAPSEHCPVVRNDCILEVVHSNPAAEAWQLQVVEGSWWKPGGRHLQHPGKICKCRQQSTLTKLMQEVLGKQWASPR